MLRQVFSQLQSRMPPFEGLRLLDYGCGLGGLLTVAREFGLDPEGIEQDPVASREASTRLGKRTYSTVSDLLSHNPAAQFDFVTLWNVIEHLREPWSDLRQLRLLLRPGGWLLVTTMNVNSVRGRLQGSSWENYANPTHFYYFHRRSLQRVIRSAGFGSIEEWKPRLRHPHHGTLRHLFFKFSYSFGISGGVFYLSRADCSLARE
jgi:2-polyprenyl-3-methyl-5-hydroxy-6-metoxy-1,4-benzoquinol methylase